MASNRIGRINEEIQRELADLLRTLKDPRVQAMISVTRVETTGDLRYAKVYISVLEKERRREIGNRLQLRYTPELVFELDDSIEHGAHIFDLIAKLHDQEEQRGERHDEE